VLAGNRKKLRRKFFKVKEEAADFREQKRLEQLYYGAAGLSFTETERFEYGKCCDWHMACERVQFSKKTHGDKQLAQKTVGSRDHCTSRVCSGLMDRVAEGCNIRSLVALA
jgi:hypothetical protein